MPTTHPLFLVVSILCVATTARAGDLHMADIQALAKSGSWVELLARATEVPPSERDASWSDLVTKAATARANDNALTDSSVVGDLEALLQAYPHLANNREFMDARGRRGIIAFEGCFRDSYDVNNCLEHAKVFVERDPKNVTLAKQMANAVARNTAPKSPAVDYFHRAVSAARGNGEAGAKDVKSICADELLEGAVAASLSNYDAPNPWITKAQELVDWCWPHMNHDQLLRDVLDNDRGFTNGCSVLLAKKAVSGARESKCKKAVKK